MTSLHVRSRVISAARDALAGAIGLVISWLRLLGSTRSRSNLPEPRSPGEGPRPPVSARLNTWG